VYVFKSNKNEKPENKTKFEKISLKIKQFKNIFFAESENETMLENINRNEEKTYTLSDTHESDTLFSTSPIKHRLTDKFLPKLSPKNSKTEIRYNNITENSHKVEEIITAETIINVK
jgi:hypothetical protein